MRLSVLALVLAASAASAQPGGWPTPPAGPSVSVDLLYAVGDDLGITTTDVDGQLIEDGELGIVSTALVLGARVPVGRRLTAVAELPVAYAAYDFPESVDVSGFYADGLSDVALGNPYVGVQAGVRPDLSLDLGVRVPLAPNRDLNEVNGWEGGLRAAPERFEAYLPDTFAALLGVAYVPALNERLRLRLRAEPALLVPTTDQVVTTDPDLALGYGAALDAAVGRATLSGGVLGRQILTDGRYDTFFDADAVAVLGASVAVGGVRPSVAVRVPLYDAVLGQDATVALRLDVPIR
ncbi:hypothetical protein [Rubrivirga marina]|uniref:Transporter n=1 Tax=Rubrivirga marina TaxID=1196024 RepID=A0A271IWW8_9BACT|nr:hypothetical protein [Rubrivirga marina]PAP75215.1 hypothetical protein BSZ37_01535 [Rubrivirga marina]